MIEPGRKYSAGIKYRYGFNGKEKDNEVKGDGLQLDYGFRVYDPRLGKFLSVDPLFKSYPWYTPYQFAGNKPIMAIDLDGLEEWVAIFWSGSTKPSHFKFDPTLKPLGAGQIYKKTLDMNAASKYEVCIYDVNKNAVVNMAFIPDKELTKKDIEENGFMSAYKIDRAFFKALDKKSENFAAIGAKNLEQMVFEGVSYAMENNVSIKDMIMDYHGTNHHPQRPDNELHGLYFGATKLSVDATGKPVDYDERTSQLFQLLGKFTNDGSETLMGHCNADKCTQILQKISKDTKSTLYGHKAYSYSGNLQNGRFYGGFINAHADLLDGTKNSGKYIKVTPDGTTTNEDNGVEFSNDKTTAGDVSPVKKNE